MINLDKIDHEILEILSKDSRISQRVIAEGLHIGVATVNRRIKSMEQLGIITQYTIIVDYSKLGKNYLLCCFIQLKSGTNIGEITKQMAEFKDIRNICYIAGDFELSIIANCFDQEKAMLLVSQISKIPEVTRVVPHVIFKQFK